MAKNKISNNALVNAIAYIVVGILFCIFRAGLINWLMTIAGVVFIVLGVCDALKGNMVQGVIGIVTGIIMILGGWLFVTLVLLIFGVLLTAKGVIALLEVLKTSKKDMVGIGFAALTILIGVLLIVSKWALVDIVFVIIGALLIINGAIKFSGFIINVVMDFLKLKK